MKKKLLTFYFKSGNSCDVLVDGGRLKIGAMNSIHIKWDVFPPSRGDQVEWQRVCLPKLCEEMAKMGLGGEPLIFQCALPEGNSQLEAFCTSGDSPGEEGKNDW
ncbi:hypothetical protein MYX82_06930 [Acidobacteria bacterium AH-259-D05]|nr:hypothetical protein [Acidobacteria bacterium AH-259-D05]